MKFSTSIFLVLLLITFISCEKEIEVSNRLDSNKVINLVISVRMYLIHTFTKRNKCNYEIQVIDIEKIVYKRGMYL